jgi:transcriptional regulator with XRE-family HTH domain
MALAGDIKSVREFARLTREELAARTREMFVDKEFHVSADYLKKLETDSDLVRRVPSDPKARAIASACGVIPDSFLLERLPHHLTPAFLFLSERSWTRPAYELDVRECWRVCLQASADRLRQRLPRGVELATTENAVVEVLFQRLREATIGEHAECVMYTRVIYGGRPYVLVLDYFVDSWLTVCIAREVYGYPARLGHPLIDRSGARLTVSGLPLLSLKVIKYLDEERPVALGEPPRAVWPERIHLCHKQIASPDGVNLAVDQLVSFEPELRVRPAESTKRRAEVAVCFFTALFRILWGLNDVIAKAMYMTNYSVTLPPGQVARDYGRDGG